MKTKLFFSAFIFVTFTLSTLSQNKKNSTTSQIEFESPEFINKKYYLAGHYGKYQVLLDSTKANSSGKLIFKTNKKYTEGIYILATADKKVRLEFLMDKEQKFSIKIIDSAKHKLAIKDSPLNIDFKNSNEFISSKIDLIQNLETTLADKKTKKDSSEVYENIKKIRKEITAYKSDYIAKNKNNTLALNFRLSQPNNNFDSKPKEEKLLTRKDSIAYLKNHFFDGIDFKDPRLIRNPFLENQITYYFNTYVPINPENVTLEIDKILGATSTPNGDTFKYLSLNFVDLYSEPKIMGMDRVFINLYDKYFKDKEFEWISLKQKELLKFKVSNIRFNLIGDKARDLFMLNLDKKRLNLYDVNDGNYIVLIFWDPTCSHCTTEVPKVHQLYEKEWKSKGISVYAVNVNRDENEKWKEFIKKEKLDDWINVYPTPEVFGNYTKEDVDFHTLYNVRQTPMFYLLDKNKTIIAKKIEPDKYVEIINQLEKTAIEKK